MRTSTKFIAAAAMAVTLLIAVATPASAGGPFNIEVTSGDLTTALGVFDLSPGSTGTPPCDEKPDNLKFYTDADAIPAGANRWSVSGLRPPPPPVVNPPGTFSGFFQLGDPPAGQWYQADFSILGAGTYAAKAPPNPPDYTLAGTLTFSVTIYEVDETDCEKSVANRKCIIAGRFVITAGFFTGTLPNPSVGDFASIDATTNTPGGLALVTSACSAPFVAANGTHATLDDLVMTVIP